MKISNTSKERLFVLKETLNLKDDFAVNRHSERTELMDKRLSCATILLDRRDIFAQRRHTEKLEFIDRRFMNKA